MQNMNQISLDMYQTLGMAVAVLFLGAFLKKRIKFLETFCIPSPVVGGLIFAIVSCILYATGILEISFDETLKNVCMVIFFTSVGFQANLKVLKSGGLSLVVFLVCVIVLIISQNLVSVGLAKLVGVSPLIGLSTGSQPFSRSRSQRIPHRQVSMPRSRASRMPSVPSMPPMLMSPPSILQKV